MTRHYCDVCGEDMTKVLTNGNRVFRKLGFVAVQVMVEVKGGWNAGDVCRKCVLEVVAKGKDYTP